MILIYKWICSSYNSKEILDKEIEKELMKELKKCKALEQLK